MASVPTVSDTAQPRATLGKGWQTRLALATTIVLWASAFVGIRAALPAYGPLHLAVLRFLVASIAISIIALALKVRLPARSDLGRIALCGLLGIAGYNIALNLGELEVSAGVASLLVNTGPVWTALLAQLFLNERLRAAGWAGIGIAFSGAVIIALGSGSQIGLSGGALLVLLAAVLLSLYSVVQKPLLKRYRPVEVTTYSILAGTIMLLPFAGGLIQVVAAAPLGPTLAAIFLGIGPAALAYVAWSIVLNHMPAGQAAAFLYLVSPVVIGLAWLWLGELPTSAALGGGVLALVGVSIVARWGKA